MKKNYKDFEKKHIGTSDMASLIIKAPGLLKELNFGEDGSYRAYICYGDDVEIGDHYEKVASGCYWLKIYDDEGLSYKEAADEFNSFDIYQSGHFGVIIHWHNEI